LATTTCRETSDNPGQPRTTYTAWSWPFWGFVRFVQRGGVPGGRIGANLGQPGTTWDNQRKLHRAPAGRIGPIWTNLDQSGPISPTPDQSGLSWTNPDQSGTIRTNLDECLPTAANLSAGRSQAPAGVANALQVCAAGPEKGVDPTQRIRHPAPVLLREGAVA